MNDQQNQNEAACGGSALTAVLGTLPICGQNSVLPARFVGCGKPIEDWALVYRCTHCDVPFHKDCANTHFEGPILTNEMIDAMTPEEVERACKALGGPVPNERIDDGTRTAD